MADAAEAERAERGDGRAVEGLEEEGESGRGLTGFLRLEDQGLELVGGRRERRTRSLRPWSRRETTSASLASVSVPPRTFDQCGTGGGEMRSMCSTMCFCPLRIDRQQIVAAEREGKHALSLGTSANNVPNRELPSAELEDAHRMPFLARLHRLEENP